VVGHNVSDYGMILDIPTWVIHDKKASAACQITTLQEAVDATKYNNDYFMKHRKGVEWWCQVLERVARCQSC
jgi:hypothetical protein